MYQQWEHWVIVAFCLAQPAQSLLCRLSFALHHQLKKAAEVSGMFFVFIFVQWEEMGMLHPSLWATWKKKAYVTQLGCSLVTFTLSLIDIRSDLPETHGEAECKCDKCRLLSLNSVYSAHPRWSYNVYTRVCLLFGVIQVTASQLSSIVCISLF